MSQKIVMRPLLNQQVAISGASASSTALTRPGIRLVATVDCFIRLTKGASNAVVTDMFLPGGTVEYLNRDDCDTVSVISSGSTGTLYVSEMG